MKKKITGTLLIIAMLITLLPNFTIPAFAKLATCWAELGASADSGVDYIVSEDGNTYTIKTELGLGWLAYQVDYDSEKVIISDSSQTAQIDFTGKTIILEKADGDAFDMSNYEGYPMDWIPIGNCFTNFNATAFYGEGNQTISNLRIIADKTNECNGFFGNYSSDSAASIYNLTFINANITADFDDEVGVLQTIGVLAGKFMNGTVSNVSVIDSSIDYSSASSNSVNIGGLIGYSTGVALENVSVLSTSGTSFTSITASTTSTQSGTGYFGGIIGRLRDGSMNKSFCNADIQINDVLSDNTAGGGLVGQNNGVIYNSSATGTLSLLSGGNADDSVGAIAGGIAGNNPESIYNCYSTVTVSGSDSVYVGGIAGYNAAVETIQNCYAMGTLSGAVGKVGGISGKGTGTIKDSYWLEGQIGSDDIELTSGSYLGSNCSAKTLSDFKNPDMVASLNSNISKLNTSYIWLNWTIISNQNNGAPVFDTPWDEVGKTAVQDTDYTISSDGNTYTILTEKGLGWVAYQVNYTAFGELITNDGMTPANNFSGKTIILNASDGEFNMSGHFWNPIGNRMNGFRVAEFNGGGQTIRNMSIPAGTGSSFGVVGFIGQSHTKSKAKYHDLTFLNATIIQIASSVSSKEGLSMGVFCGAIANADITNINVKNSSINYSCSVNDAISYVGGLVGFCEEDKVEDVSVSGTKITTLGSSAVGGVIGVLEYESLLNKAYCDADIQANASGGEGYVGGLVGAAGVIINSYSTGTISLSDVNSSDLGLIGGIIGFNMGSVYNCYSTTAVTGVDNVYVGGIAGANASPKTIRNCYAAGTLVGTLAVESTSTNHVGGLAGIGDGGAFKDSYWLSSNGTVATVTIDGEVEYIENCAAKTLSELQKKDGVLKDLNAKIDGLPTENEEYKYTWTIWIIKSGVNNGMPVLECFYKGDTTQPDNSTGGVSNSGSNVPVKIGNETVYAGRQTTGTTADGRSSTTVTVDPKLIDTQLKAAGEKATVTVPISGSQAEKTGVLTGQMVKDMEARTAVLEIKTDSVSYTLPASQIYIDAVSAQLGSQVALKDIKVSIRIAEPPADTVKIVQDTANKNSYQLVVKPVEFEITCTSGGKTVDVSRFNGYVERTVAIPDGIDPSKITTGIVLNNDGTFSHVPTQIVKIDGKYYAKINSLTNSTYSVLFNPITFTDVANHWAKDAINDMGSRMVVTGVGDGSYEPDRSITRAEFAAIAVRALGLQKSTTESSFGDVSATDWFNGYVDKATEYGIITGYNATTYSPNDTITREQAMAILARAMKLTGLSVSLTNSEVSTLLASFTDGATISDYAKASVASCIKEGLVTGTSSTTISPKAYVTRAEVAVMVQRLLQKSGLI
ncbi:MAG: hypothetical protein CVU91_04190 [Firmicutes bacterium HGW-Firmicutes-16]|nr:MAG: hypothetical protein CVU91_04190 [Firmicutes bacterium HGW-Firmicutes-16]